MSELQQSWWTIVLDIQKVPLQGSYSVPAESVLALYCNIKVKRHFIHSLKVLKGGDRWLA